MTESANDKITETMKPLTDFFAAMHAEFTKVGAALNAAMTEWAQSPSGQYLLAVARYYEEHPEELEGLHAANRAVSDCNCLCQRWHHLGACTGEAVTGREFSLGGEAHRVPLCQPCADSIDSQRPVPA